MSTQVGTGFNVNAAAFQPGRAGNLRWSAMQPSDVDQVMQIEVCAYLHPWSRGNFLESLESGYAAHVVRDAANCLAGYFVAMEVVDELHLLNITVRQDLQGQGIGRLLLDKIVALAADKGAVSILLEVRPSNGRALAVYERYGFLPIGRRKGYYPAAGLEREDAIVMRLMA